MIDFSRNPHSIQDLEAKAGIAPTVQAFIDGLSTPPSTAKTDADGKFSLALKKGTRYAIRAVASRAVFDRTENYEWLV